MPYRRGRVWWTRIPKSRVQVSLQTTDRKTAEALERFLLLYWDSGSPHLRTAIQERRVDVRALYDAWRMGRLDALAASLDDVDLNTYVGPWQRWAVRNGAQSVTVAKYVTQLRALVPADRVTPRSTLTRAAISTALADLGVSGSTTRRYHAAWSSFFGYLVEMNVIETNPMRSIRAPKENAARDLWLESADVLRLVDAHPEPFRSLAALREGAGVEVSAALGVRARDVDVERRLVYVRGTKRAWRARWVKLDAWAWKRFAGALAGKLPTALLFPVRDDQATPRGLSRAGHRVLRELRKALTATKLPLSYTTHDARHSYAVRHVKQGTPYKAIADNLGHKDELLVIKVYGKHRRTKDEIAGSTHTAQQDAQERHA